MKSKKIWGVLGATAIIGTSGLVMMGCSNAVQAGTDDERVSQIQSLLDQANRDIANYRERIAEYTGQITQLQASINSFNLEIINLNIELVALTHQRDTAEASLNGQAVYFNDRIAALEARIANLIAERDNQATRIHVLTLEIGSLNINVSKLQDKIDSLLAQNNDLSQYRDGLREAMRIVNLIMDIPQQPTATDLEKIVYILDAIDELDDKFVGYISAAQIQRIRTAYRILTSPYTYISYDAFNSAGRGEHKEIENGVAITGNQSTTDGAFTSINRDISRLAFDFASTLADGQFVTFVIGFNGDDGNNVGNVPNGENRFGFAKVGDYLYFGRLTSGISHVGSFEDRSQFQIDQIVSDGVRINEVDRVGINFDFDSRSTTITAGGEEITWGINENAAEVRFLWVFTNTTANLTHIGTIA